MRGGKPEERAEKGGGFLSFSRRVETIYGDSGMSLKLGVFVENIGGVIDVDSFVLRLAAALGKAEFGGKPSHFTLANHWARLIELLYVAERMVELVGPDGSVMRTLKRS
jgi:hypothetical protein